MANFNVPPYYDDYDEGKEYYKIMFRPSVAIQARELNQMQTMLQKQIERFGSHIFREGSIVLGGAFDLELDVSYIKAVSILPSEASLNSLVGKTIVGQTTGIEAIVRAVEYDSDNNVYAILLRYISSSLTSDVYLNDEVVKVSDTGFTDLGFTVVSSSVANYQGRGSIFSIGQGVVFSKGYFLAFPSQTVIVEKYSSTPTKTLGMKVTESFVTELNDTSLLDNALGTTNENAPGAHRYKVACDLVSITYKTGYEDENFIPLMDLANGVIETTKERTQYARIYEELAKRTYDESGDYLISGFDLRTREHLDTGANEGLYTANEGGDSTKLSIDVTPGLGYVKGYEVSKLVTQHVITDKATTYNYVSNQLVNAGTGGFFLINEIVGSVDHDQGFLVNLYDAAETRISSNKSNLVAPTGNLIGTARIKCMIYESGVLGKPEGSMRAYIYDYNVIPGYTLTETRGIGSTTSFNQFFADVMTTTFFAANGDQLSTESILYNSNINNLLFPLGAKNVRSVRSNTGSVNTTFQFIRSENKTANVANSTSITTSVTTTGESLQYSGSLSTAEKREILVSINSNTLIQLPGTVTGSNSSNVYAVTGVGTSFTNLTVGDRLSIFGNTYYVNAITNNTVLQLKTAISNSFSSAVFFKSLISGDIIDLTANGSTGLTRSASVTSGTLTIDFKEVQTNVTPTAVSAKLTYKVQRENAAEIKKILNSNRYIKINVGANTLGPFNLGLPDIFKLRSVRVDSSAFTNSTGSTSSSDVTSYFSLDTGQRDNSYDHGRLIYNGGVPGELTGKHLLVEVDHFVPDYSGGFGYFSVDSYPINDNSSSSNSIFTYELPKYISSSGIEYQLKDVLDFRPVKQATANSAALVDLLGGLATTNPVTSNDFIVDADGLRLAFPDSDIKTNYSFYMGRRDIVTIDKQGSFGVVKGQPAINPLTPNISDSVMGLATVYIPPYPSISETLARILNAPTLGCSTNKIANYRFTMRDIGVLKNRIENLEYYNALTLLEKSAIDLKIVDEQGLDRFKNGFFVDGFLDHSLGDTSNIDYNISVDKAEQLIRPVFTMDSFQYRVESSGSSGYQETGALITRPYSQVTLLENKNVTTTRNIEQSVFRFVGTIQLSPEGDVWVDSKTVDKRVQLGDNRNSVAVLDTEWGSWENYVVGYNVYGRNDRSGVPDPQKFKGTYTSYAAAVNALGTRTPNEKVDISNLVYFPWSVPGTGNNVVLPMAAKSNPSWSTNKGLIETIGGQQRTNIQTVVSYETFTQVLGNFVTDVSVQPYIRPQVIRVYVKGLKANTKYYCYFDGENMSSYIVPGTIPTNRNIDQVSNFAAEGSEWRADEFGELLGYLRLPPDGKRFRTGTKEIIVTDSPTNSIDATSYAKSHWVASGLSVKKENTIVSTRFPVYSSRSVVETAGPPTKQRVEIWGPSCMAYSFKVDVPVGEDGVFLTSVDVWVDSKHPSLGVWFEIREMDSAGGITRTQVPFSEVWLNQSQVNLWDGTSATEESNKTRITFPSPVFLLNDTQYAFVIHTEGLNPDYYFWVSRLGETDILTNKQVTARQLTGTLFTTNNNLNYDIVPDVDLKVRFNRAQFAVGNATLILANKPTEFLNVANVFAANIGAGSFLRSGETIISSEYLNFDTTTNGANSIVANDKIVGITSGISANVIGIVGANYYVDYYGFIQDETFQAYDSANTYKSITGAITLVDGGSGTFRSYNTQNNFMIIDNSNGKFYNNAVIFATTSGDRARVSGFDKFRYSTTTLKPYYLVFNKTNCTFEKSGWLSNATPNTFDTYISSQWFPGTVDSYSYFNNEVAILSRKTELDVFGNSSPNSSARVRIILSTDSEYVSPVVDVSRAQSIYVHNVINNDDTNETNSSGGNLINKYISKPVKLADGQDAEDLLVKISVYKPPQTDVKVWMKASHDDDIGLFRENSWIEMDYANNLFSSEANLDDFIELNYLVPNRYKNANGVFRYVKNSTNIFANNLWSNASGTYGINASANSILIPNADTIFSGNDVVYYGVPPGNVAITPLTSNSYYYISTVNSTAITLSNTAGGAQIDITDFRTDATAEVHTIGGTVFDTYKQYSVKIGLFGTNSAKPPRVADLRTIALQT